MDTERKTFVTSSPSMSCSARSNLPRWSVHDT